MAKEEAMGGIFKNGVDIITGETAALSESGAEGTTFVLLSPILHAPAEKASQHLEAQCGDQEEED